MTGQPKSLFLEAISRAIASARAKGCAPSFTIDRRTPLRVGEYGTSGITPREQVRQLSSFGPLGRWMLSSLLIAGAGCALTFTDNAPGGMYSPAREISGMVKPASAVHVIEQHGIRMIPVRFKGKQIHSVHPEDRIAIVKRASERESLDRMIGDEAWKLVYGMIQAESNWIPRDGLGRNNRISVGVAQMELPTAESLGIDPHNPHEAAQGVAKLVKEAVETYKTRLRKGMVISDERGRKLEHRKALAVYISVHYNTSSKFRSEWDGRISSLHQPTRVHIKNVTYGIGEAGSVDREIKANKAYEGVTLQPDHLIEEFDSVKVEVSPGNTS